ncbi:asparaginase [Mycobacterium sp. OAE908]
MAVSPSTTASSASRLSPHGALTEPSGPCTPRVAVADTRPVVVVLATGGTIASVTDPRAGRVLRSGDAHIARLPAFADFEVRTVPVFMESSFALTAKHWDRLRQAVAEHLSAPHVAGVVITHGTDSIEETAYLLQLLHGDSRPVVVTGAIRPADAPEPDGPSNLRDAVIVAASTSARNRGVLVVFDGLVFAAAGTRKVDTTARAAFDSPDFGPVGSVRDGHPVFAQQASPVAPLPAVTECADLSSVRVDIVAAYPGADDIALRAHAAAGARGLILEATGSGNAPPPLVSAVSELTGAGLIVVVSSRVHRGSISPLYGGQGGGRELVAAGAIPAGWMRPSQARIALMALLADGDGHRSVRERFTSLAAEPAAAQRLQL